MPVEPNPGEQALIAAFAEPSAEPVVEAAPAASVTPEAPVTPAAPEAAVVPAATATPTAPVAAPATQPPASDPEKSFQATILNQNRQLTETIQQQLVQQRVMMDRLLQEAKPELTPAQREEQVQQAFTALNADPEKYIKTLIENEVKRFEADATAKYAPRDQQIERQQVIGKQLNALYRDGQGNVLRPELANDAFVQQMISPEMQQEVWDKYHRGVPVETLVNSPAFFTDLYHATVQKQAATAAQAQTRQAGDAALEAQRQTLQTHGSATGAPKAPATAPVDPGQQLVKDMQGLASPSQRFAQDAKWENRGR